MKVYQLAAFEAMIDACDIRGKRVLEIGDGLECEVARAFIEAGATQREVAAEHSDELPDDLSQGRNQSIFACKFTDHTAEAQGDRN